MQKINKITFSYIFYRYMCYRPENKVSHLIKQTCDATRGTAVFAAAHSRTGTICIAVVICLLFHMSLVLNSFPKH